MKQIAVIVAGGAGKRMNTDIPKQFLLLNGVPVLMRTIRVFYNYNPDIEIIIALPAGQEKYWQTLCKKHKFNIPHQVVPGGGSRHQTVKNALSKMLTDSLVAIHDGVRPLVTNSLITTCFDTASVLGNAVPVVELSESLRELDGDGNTTADRARFRLVQTPQVFRSDQLFDALEKGFKKDFTDEASLVEAAGYAIHLVRGQLENIKITTSLDMCIASALIDNTD